jgi:hypothetical protein
MCSLTASAESAIHARCFYPIIISTISAKDLIESRLQRSPGDEKSDSWGAAQAVMNAVPLALNTEIYDKIPALQCGVR